MRFVINDQFSTDTGQRPQNEEQMLQTMLSERWDLLLSLRPQTYSVQVHRCKCLAARCSYLSGSLSDPLEVCDLKYAVFAHG